MAPFTDELLTHVKLNISLIRPESNLRVLIVYDQDEAGDMAAIAVTTILT